jgi:hypothetical protein
MAERVVVTRAELEQAASVARSLDRGAALAALCYDVLGRQAEGQSLFTGKKFLSGRAKAVRVTHQDAETPLGNLLAVLERGPQSSLEYALVVALYVRGFEAVTRAQPQQRKALVERFAVHCEFLELSTPYRVLPLCELLLPPELAGEIHAALAALVLRDDQQDATPEERARNAGRIAALGEAQSEAARDALGRIAEGARDPFSRALARCALGEPAPSPSAERTLAVRKARVRGRLHAPARSGYVTVLGWLSGVTALRWALRLPLAMLGYSCELEAELALDAIRVRRTTQLLGRTLEKAEQVYPLARLRAAQRASRFPTMHFILGAFFFALGVLLGGIFAFDAARTGDRALWLIAFALLMLGSGLDLVLEVLVPGGRGRVLLDLDFGQPHRMRLAGVAIEDADRFLGELWRRFSRAEGQDRAVA